MSNQEAITPASDAMRIRRSISPREIYSLSLQMLLLLKPYCNTTTASATAIIATCHTGDRLPIVLLS